MLIETSDDSDKPHRRVEVLRLSASMHLHKQPGWRVKK